MGGPRIPQRVRDFIKKDYEAKKEEAGGELSVKDYHQVLVDGGESKYFDTFEELGYRRRVPDKSILCRIISREMRGRGPSKRSSRAPAHTSDVPAMFADYLAGLDKDAAKARSSDNSDCTASINEITAAMADGRMSQEEGLKQIEEVVADARSGTELGSEAAMDVYFGDEAIEKLYKAFEALPDRPVTHIIKAGTRKHMVDVREELNGGEAGRIRDGLVDVLLGIESAYEGLPAIKSTAAKRRKKAKKKPEAVIEIDRSGMQILEFMNKEGPKSINALKKNLTIAKRTVKSCLNDYEEKGIIEHTDKGYGITEKGKKTLIKNSELKDAESTLVFLDDLNTTGTMVVHLGVLGTTNGGAYVPPGRDLDYLEEIGFITTKKSRKEEKITISKR